MLEDDRILGICIIADVIASRKADKKEELKKMVSMLNETFKEGLLTDFTVRSGDEIFGILRKFSDSYRALKEMLRLSDELNVPLYVGLGLGFITNRDITNPHEVNGPAIWDAADALSMLKKEKNGTHKGVQIQKTFKFYFYSSGDLPYEALNSHLYFLFERVLKRTEKQKEVVEAVENLADSNKYGEIGERLGYDKFPSTNVSKILARADFNLVSNAEKSLIKLLNYFQKQIQSNEDISRD
ncbi:SatD family protein [Cohnella luojiensis]|uniref:Uncharacterized protein n=1 Tax=Cohnella luojiensis TaxID=652876 RepID=A0A4Y8LYV3_9BACL|nr:SatD family protein [Cohnella luojiensis]TFE25174.1 hypothetical protein E2980_14050 [Cohnella luojiensis]